MTEIYVAIGIGAFIGFMFYYTEDPPLFRIIPAFVVGAAWPIFFGIGLIAIPKILREVIERPNGR